DRLGRQVLRAASQTEPEIEAAADSPFLFARVRARIAEEGRRQSEAGGWLTLPFVARRAVPAMALIALLTAGITLWPSQSNVPAGYGIYDEALSDTRDPGVEQAVLSRNNLSPDDVFNIVLERDEREKR
ncbi:MAG: hypothetical protein ACXW3C_13550, partial [Pyrinomonadaceae bacterium]